MIALLCRLFLAGVFLVASIGKFKRPMVFLRSVLDFRLMPGPLVPWFAAMLPGIELVCGLVVLTGALGLMRHRNTALARWTDAATWILTALLVAFTAGIAIDLLRGFKLDCGCFDIVGSVVGEYIPFFKPHAASWWTVVRDLVFLLPAVYLVRNPSR